MDVVLPTQRRFIAAIPMGTKVIFAILSKHVVKHFLANNAYTQKPYKKHN